MARLARAAAALHDQLRECPLRPDAQDASLLYLAMIEVLLRVDPFCRKSEQVALRCDGVQCARCTERTRELAVSLARWERLSQDLRALVEGFLEPFTCERCGRAGLLVRELGRPDAAR